LGPSPPERAEHEVSCGQAHHHVATEKKTVEEKDDETNRNNTENETWNKR